MANTQTSVETRRLQPGVAEQRLTRASTTVHGGSVACGQIRYLQSELVALIGKRAVEQQDPKTPPALAAIQARAQPALDSVRNNARGIYPPALADLVIGEALRAQAKRAPARASIAGTAPRSNDEPEPRGLSPAPRHSSMSQTCRRGGGGHGLGALRPRRGCASRMRAEASIRRRLAEVLALESSAIASTRSAVATNSAPAQDGAPC